MATWNRDDSDLTIGVGIGSTTIGSNLTLSANELDVASGDLTLDVAGGFILDTSTGQIDFKKNGNTFISIDEASGGASLIQNDENKYLKIAASGVLNLTSTTAYANIDTSSGYINLYKSATGFGRLEESSGELVLKSGTTPTTALTFSGANATIAGNLTVSGGIANSGTISSGTWSGTALVADKVPNHDNLNGFVVNEHINWTLESAGTIHSSNYINTQLSDEQVQDRVGAMFTGNTETNITATYQDADGTIDLIAEIGASDIADFKNEEQIQDIVGAMFSSNTETNTAVTYQDGDGTIDVVTTLDGAPLTTEAVQDIVGAMFTGNTETNTAVTYQDGDGTIDVVSLNDNTTYSAGSLLDLSTTTFNVDLTELTDGAGADVVGSEDELVYLDDNVQKRKLISGIKLGQFNNDQGWTANTGTISWDGSTANGVATYKDADEATVESNLTFDGTDLSIASSGKLILGAGDTSIAESSADVLTITVGSEALLTFTEVGSNSIASFSNLGGGLILPYDSKLYFDGGSDTYIVNDATDQLTFTAGNTEMLRLKEDGATNGDHATFGATGVGFTQFAPTYNATDTYVYFNRSGNKGHLTFGAASTAIVDIHMHFPPVSGNFTLVIKQHGSGGGSVTNWKTFDEAGGNESTVVWPAATAPTLTTGANKIDIISVYWDNTNHKAYGVASLNF